MKNDTWKCSRLRRYERLNTIQLILLWAEGLIWMFKHEPVYSVGGRGLICDTIIIMIILIYLDNIWGSVQHIHPSGALSDFLGQATKEQCLH